MLELLLSLGAVSVFGVIAIALAGPPAPQALALWNDEELRRAADRAFRERR